MTTPAIPRDTGRAQAPPRPRVARRVVAAAMLAAPAAIAMSAPTAVGIAISVTPSNLVIPAGQTGTLTVTNPEQTAVTYDLTVGNYDIADNGTVRIDPAQPPTRSAKDWITLGSSTLTLGPRESTTLAVATRRVSIAAPGDHHALVLVTTRAQGTAGGVGVRARVGVGVVVRVPGTLRRIVRVGDPFVVRRHGKRFLSVRLTNRGNINERFQRGQVRIDLLTGGRVGTTLRSAARTLLPGTSGTFTMPYTGRLRGAVTARATVRFADRAQSGPGIASIPPSVIRQALVTL